MLLLQLSPQSACASGSIFPVMHSLSTCQTFELRLVVFSWPSVVADAASAGSDMLLGDRTVHSVHQVPQLGIYELPLSALAPHLASSGCCSLLSELGREAARDQYLVTRTRHEGCSI